MFDPTLLITIAVFFAGAAFILIIFLYFYVYRMAAMLARINGFLFQQLGFGPDNQDQIDGLSDNSKKFYMVEIKGNLGRLTQWESATFTR